MLTSSEDCIMYNMFVIKSTLVTKSGNIAYPCVVCCVIDDGKGEGDLLGREQLIMQRTRYYTAS